MCVAAACRRLPPPPALTTPLIVEMFDVRVGMNLPARALHALHAPHVHRHPQTKRSAMEMAVASLLGGHPHIVQVGSLLAGVGVGVSFQRLGWGEA